MRGRAAEQPPSLDGRALPLTRSAFEASEYYGGRVKDLVRDYEVLQERAKKESGELHGRIEQFDRDLRRLERRYLVASH